MLTTPGVRVRLRGNLGTARVVVQVDVGFGDTVYPKALLAELRVLVDILKLYGAP